MKSDTLQPYHRIFYVIGLVAAVGILMFSIAAAQTEPEATSTPQDTVAQSSMPAPMVVDIQSDGTALIRGTVTQAGADSITIESWGGTWTIRMNDDGTVIPSGSGGDNDASAIQVGHFVGAEGSMAQGAQLAIDASFVRDWTTDPYTGPAVDTTTTGDTGFLIPNQSIVSDTSTGTDTTTSAGMGAGTATQPPTETGTGTNGTGNADDTTGNDTEDTDEDNATSSASSWNGTVDTVREDSFTFTTDTGTRYTVDVSGIDATSFVDEDGDEIDIGNVDENDEVTIEGTYNGIEINPTRVEVETGLF
jgi:hypothetical protein